MLNLKLIARLSKFHPMAATCSWSPRAIVTTARPLQCKKNEDSSEDVKEAAESIKNAANSVSENAKKISDKVSETTDIVKEKASEIISLGAAKIATEIVRKKNEMKEEEKKNKNKSN